MTFQKVKISSFLKERESRIKPAEANKMGLKRLNKIDFSGEIHLSEKSTNTDMILVKQGDLVISGINVEKGAVAVYQGDEDILATIHYSAYIFDETKIDIEYFKTFLKSQAFRDVITSQTRNGIKTEIKAKIFLNLEINLPDLETQLEVRDKINLFSGKVNEVENFQDKNLVYITKLRQAILQSAVKGELVKQDPKDEPASELLKKIKAEKEKLIKEKLIQRPKEKGEINEKERNSFNIPKNWVLAKMTDLCFVTKMAGFEYTKYVHLKDFGEVPVIRAQNVRKNRIDETNLKYLDLKTSKCLERCSLTKKSLLVTFIGAGIGDIAVFDKKERWHLAPNVAKIEPFNNYQEKIDVKYLLYYLLSGFGQKELFKFYKALAQPSLSMGTIRQTIICLPPLSEQKRIVEKVDRLMTYCDELEKQVKENQQNTEKLMGAVLKESFENG